MSSKDKKPPLFAAEYFFYDFVKLTAAIPGLLWFRPKVLYASEAAKKKVRGGALLISNHTAVFDPIYLQIAVWYRRHRFVCLKEFFEGRGGWFFKSFLCIPIDRENFNLSSFREITDHLKRGELVSMFPEGRINDETEGVAAFKSGMVLMAVRSGVPILPVYIRKWEGFPRRLTMAVGEAIDITALCGGRPTMSQIEEISSLLHEKEDGLRELAEKRK
jgi:1-acyl-sn-glycerol-3-phosphate acyltransferase